MTNFQFVVFVQNIVKTPISVKELSKSEYLWNLKSSKNVHFPFFSKILSKSPCVRVSHFFVFSIFVKKVTFKIPIGTILNFFCKKSRFLHTLEIIDFTWDNHVIYRKKITFFFRFSTHFPHSWRVEISLFSIIFPIVQTHTPHPLSVAEKTSKSVKILPIGFSTKTQKSVITRRKWFFQNFRKKCTYGDFDENFSKFARCLGVKFLEGRKLWFLLAQAKKRNQQY